jgi:hypothetical protein
MRRLIVTDTTVEALARILRDNPRGVLITHDELSAWFGSFDAYRENKEGKDRPLWLQSWNGGRLHIDRVNQHITVPNWGASIIGVIPPGPMQRIASKLSDDGLLQRFVIVRARGTGEKVDRAADARALADYRTLVARLVTMKPYEDMGPFTLSEEAHTHRRRVQRHVADLLLLPAVQADRALASHLMKIDGLFARVLLLYHMVDAATRQEPQPELVVQGDLAAQVARLFIKFLLPHCIWFFRHVVGQRKGDDLVQFIANHILVKRLAVVTAREIYRARNSTTAMTPEIETAMRALEAFQWVTPADGQSEFHPTRWNVTPAVHTRFAERALVERRRRAEAAAKMREAGLRLGIAIEAEA